MSRILILGATGFVGGHLARMLVANGHQVRCLVRTPSRATGLDGCEIVQGDMTDATALSTALQGIDAVYISVHTLGPQKPGGGFMDIERAGIENIVAACKTTGTRRAIYVTSLGIDANAPSVWLRERSRTEQLLLTNLDATVLRPGQIVGRGGRGFEMMVQQAKGSFAPVLGNGTAKMRNIALGDLLYYLDGVREDPRTFGQAYDVGSDEVLSADAMIDLTAHVLGKKPPIKLHVPLFLLRVMAPVVERMGAMPPGAIKGITDSLKLDGIGDPAPIRAILPRPPLPYREAVKQALASPTAA